MKHLIQNGGGLALGLERAEGDRAGGFASGLVGEGLAVLLGDGAPQAGGAFAGGATLFGEEANRDRDGDGTKGDDQAGAAW